MFEPKIEEFLEGKNLGTRSIYRAGLLSFQEFYKPQGSIPDFLDKLEADRDLGWRQAEDIASKVIRKYVDWLLTTKKFKRKTVRVYVAAVQQLAKKYHVPFSTNDTHLPVSNPDLKKYPWTVDDAVRFFNLFDSPMYRSMGVFISKVSLIAVQRYRYNIVTFKKSMKLRLFHYALILKESKRIFLL